MNTRADQIEQARRLIATGISEELKEVLEQQYPELKESEDEKIRKELIDYLAHRADVTAFIDEDKDCKRWIAYLEKQKYERGLGFAEGEVEGIRQTFQEIKDAMSLYEPKHLTPFESTFSGYIDSAINYCLSGEGYQQYIKELAADLVNLERRKDQNGEDEEDNDFTIYHPLKNGKGEYECIPYSFYGSLTSFREDKDLIDFLHTCFYTEEECNEWIEQQKEPEWSEEDEGMINCIISTLCEESHGGRETNDKMVTWLEKKFKFLRPQSKPTEDELNKKYWEGYKDAMEQHNRNVSFHQDYPTSPSIPRSCYEGGPCTNPHYDCVNCPRQGSGGTYITTPNTVTSDDSNNLEAHWKPSEEQLKALESCFCEFGEGCPDEDGLRSLYNDLKKLM